MANQTTKVIIRVRRFIKEEQGLSTIEYIIGAGVMAGLALFVFMAVDDKIDGASTKVGEAITPTTIGSCA